MNPLENRPGDPLEKRARGLYLEAARRLDPATAGRLRAARRTALEAPKAAPRAGRLLLPAGAFAVIALATLMVWQPLHRGDTVPPHAASVALPAGDDNDVPPDADSTDPNLYQNLDFYGWLAANDSTPKAMH
ncbi:hypothetical protein ASG87_02165 [Frateuria sp. Soil773]|uniref:hypothetical protein n=1 Tax=Frateuria sp. Soil773 TaxID=1736407 RepID=UPI0006FCF9AF|nr:hypothetical protein [Frateuria sp. Soil773]KRE90960.1 hypothetical protein ASG87_02165 [Frateuria sp. Soil773]